MSNHEINPPESCGDAFSDGMWAELDLLEALEVAVAAKSPSVLGKKIEFIRPLSRDNEATLEQQKVSGEMLKVLVDDMMFSHMRELRQIKEDNTSNLLFQHTIHNKEYLSLSLNRGTDETTGTGCDYEVTVTHQVFDELNETDSETTHTYVVDGNNNAYRIDNGGTAFAVAPEEVVDLYSLVDGAKIYNRLSV